MTDEDTTHDDAPEDDAPEARTLMQFGFSPGRAESVDGVQPNSSSLIGSWFHVIDGDGHFAMQGCIVAEPQPMVYLVQLYEWIDGQATHQSLVHFGEMLSDDEGSGEWLFFDSAADMNRAFEEAVRRSTVG